MVDQLLILSESTQEESGVAHDSKDGLMEIKQVMRIQGYTDARSTKKWLKKNNISMIAIGKKTYVSSDAWKEYLANKSGVHIKSTELNNTESKKVVKRKIKRSKAARDFLTGIKS